MYPRIHQKIFNEVWAIQPASYDAIRAAFLNHAAQSHVATDFALTDLPEVSSMETSSLAMGTAAKGVAVIEVSGIIGKRLSSLETMCGGCDLDELRAEFQAILADSAVGTIVWHFDTPGGTVTGLKELADEIYEASQNSGKQIVAYTDTRCCSAGVHLASQCQYIGMAESARLGSIGCIITHVDQSAADVAAGLKYTTIKSGAYKDLGNPHRPLEAKEVAYLQAKVDQHAQEFFAVVERTRGEIAAKELEAEVLNGSEALAAGLVDGIHPTINHFLAAL